MSAAVEYELIYKHHNNKNWSLICRADDLESTELIGNYNKYKQKDTTEDIRVIKVTITREVISL